MKKALEYRQHAEECRMLARKAQTEEHRLQLQNMAETWESLAESRERIVRETEHLKEFEERKGARPPVKRPVYRQMQGGKHR